MSDTKYISHRKLIVWQKSRLLVKSIYKLTQTFPREELFGLTSQIRRAAVSIPSNIAEGNGRRSDGEFIRFLDIDQGSLSEVDTQLQIAVDLEFCTENNIEEIFTLLEEIGRMITALRSNLKQRVQKSLTKSGKFSNL